MRGIGLLFGVVLLAACGSDEVVPIVAGGGAGSGGLTDSGGAASVTPSPPPPADAPNCLFGSDPLVLTGHADPADAKGYRLLPFRVPAGATRIEVGYRWRDSSPLPSTPVTQSVFDLGLWDADGYRNVTGFRGWSGSRQGKLPDQAPVFVQSDAAERGYVPGPIESGVWYVDLGIAALGPAGADWEVQIRCLNPPTGPLPEADRVNSAHVARPARAWYHADFHMHAFHSQSNAPDWEGFVQQARDAELDVLLVTEYVTGRHWDELGPVQRAHPDLLIYPGREIITYFGHANTFGETDRVLEYRHGFETVTLGEIQRLAKADGALFGVNHPTTFPGPLFSNFCRGCAFELGGAIDWNQVDTIELVNGPTLVNQTDLGAPALPLPLPLQIQNPFLQSALDLWDDLLMQGYKITGVSGSDSKGVDAPEERTRKGYGSSATAIFADELSRPAISAAIRAGRAFIKTRGVAGSPHLELEVTTPDGQRGSFGDTLRTESATLRLTITGGQNQLLQLFRNGQIASLVPVISDPFVHEAVISRAAGEGPLGTYWRVQTLDAQSLTTIGNPVFLQAP